MSKGLQNKKQSPHQLLAAPIDVDGKRIPPPTTVTILRSMSINKDTGELEPATKTFFEVHEKSECELPEDKAAGRRGTIAFADIKWWEVHEQSISGIEDMFDLVDRWSRDPQAALLHGGFAGLEATRKMLDKDGHRLTRRDGMVRKMLQSFREREVVYIILDADKYAPVDPATIGEPTEMAEDWVRHNLPPSMHDVSYIFQLSSSAYVHDWLGRTDPSRDGKLDAHFVFVLESPVGIPELRAWAKALKESGAKVDISTIHATQVAYIARPIFVGKIEDPLPEGRIRLVSKSRPAVPASTFAFIYAPTNRAAATSGQATANQPATPAPRKNQAPRAMEASTTPTKSTLYGWVGSVNLAYPIDKLLDDILASRYRRAGGKRLDYLRSASGRLGSAWIHYGHMIGSKSDSDPCSLGGPWNAWDLIRDEWYGIKDKDQTWTAEHRRPSYMALLAWAKKDPLSQIANKLILRHVNFPKENLPYPTYQQVVDEYNRQAELRFLRAHPAIARDIGAQTQQPAQ